MEEVLRYAVRPRVLLRHGGPLLVAAGALTLAPAIVALLAGEAGLAPAYVGAALLLGVPGFLAARVRAPPDLRMNEALAILALAFLLVPLASAWPFSHGTAGFLDAFFEAVSGITTTGLTTLGSVEGRPRSFLFARAWMQWYGGLGFVVFLLALIARSGIAARRLELAVTDPEDLVGSTRAHARRTLVVYGLLTGAGIVLLLITGLGAFDALLHTMAAISTGGFAPRDQSLAPLGWPERAGVIALSFLGAVSLSLHARAFRGGIRQAWADLELRALVLLCAVAALLAWALGRLPLGDAVLLGMSAQTTTGFATTDIRALAPAVKASLLLAMACGGCVGSTAGGMKLLRVLIGLELVRWTLRGAGMAKHAVHEPRLSGERLEIAEIQRAFAILLLFPCIVLLSWIPFVAAGHAPLDALFEVVSATGTVGLSTGISGPHLHPALKGILCLDMWLGRLEIVAVLILLLPRTWIGRRAE